MTLKELRAMVEREPVSNDHLPVEIWLPGSTIRLSAGFVRGKHRGTDKLLIEGNLTPGSALDEPVIHSTEE